MKKALVDTNIISAFMRGNPSVVQKVEKYLRFHTTLSVSVITYYEIIRGLKAIAILPRLNRDARSSESVDFSPARRISPADPSGKPAASGHTDPPPNQRGIEWHHGCFSVPFF